MSALFKCDARTIDGSWPRDTRGAGARL